MMGTLSIHCPICLGKFNWHRGYGRDQRCCCKECYEEFSWRMALSITNKAYYHDPRRYPPEKLAEIDRLQEGIQ